MQPNLAASITYAYHFLSEAIIMFLIALPFFYHRFSYVPYGSYFVIIIGACILFSIITRYTTRYIWYIVMAPILFLVFNSLDYPMIFTVLFTLLFVWRYIDIRKEDLISRENIYILFTLLLTAIVSILVRDSFIMIYPFLQFVILFLGYITSQLVVVNKEDRKQIDLKLPFYFIGILGLGATIFFFLFESARNVALYVGQGFFNAIGGVIRGFSNILSFLTVEQRGWPEQTPDDAKHGDGYWNQLEEYNVVEGMSVFLIVAIAILLIALVTFFIMILWRKRSKQKLVEAEQSDAVSYSSLSGSTGNNTYSRNPFNKYFNRPSDPIRKLVYQFERKAAKQNKGRRPFETIEDWFMRINVGADIYVYQKVRYGGKRASDQEVKSLKVQLKEMEAKLDL
ncbi:hypothetical protein GMD78_16485 [Ornithinibacillus sp. L9]|uniref:DUF4129 domain-containing protein n=1 Tax=Ornithinibacillus caprae TaxID=2678566 RepID=A0A6N8FK09_9BACI|nr:hypothetical protein [Ornithinibacillus caprae]MUK89970.1 hypothetical protein [Ornithinibacillus caprae]